MALLKERELESTRVGMEKKKRKRRKGPPRRKNQKRLVYPKTEGEKRCLIPGKGSSAGNALVTGGWGREKARRGEDKSGICGRQNHPHEEPGLNCVAGEETERG